MSIFLILAFLFFIGSGFGWVLELLFRRFFSSANPERKWINPGFLVGPYVPLYGSGLCLLYLIAQLRLADNTFLNFALLLLLMGAAMTAIEYIAGICLLKFMHLRLWDYSKRWANLNGLICPKFSLVWTLGGGLYLFGVHPFVLDSLRWLSENLAFSFFIGLFFGVFLIDVVYSTQLAVKIKRFAKDNDIVVRYENMKVYFKQLRQKGKAHFFLALHTEQPLRERLPQYYATLKKQQADLEQIFRSKKK